MDNAYVCVHNFEVFGEGIEPFSPMSKIKYDKKFIIDNLVSNKVGGGSSFAIKKEVLCLVPFDEKLKRAEDSDWWLRLMLAEVPVVILEESLVSYRLHHGRYKRSNF